MDLTRFQDLLFDTGKALGFSDMEIYFERAEKFACNIYQGEIDSYESAEVAGLSFRGVYQGKMGYAFTELVEEDSITVLLENARENALVLEDEDGDEIFGGSRDYRDGIYYSEELDAFTTDQKIAFITDVERQVRAYDPRVSDVTYCMLESASRGRLIANNRGLVQSDERNHLMVYVDVVVKSQGEVKSASYAKATRELGSLDAALIARDVCDEALGQLGSVGIGTKAYPVLLRNDAAAALLGTFVSAFYAENVQKGRSVLKGKIGARIGVDTLSILDNPFRNDGLASRNFDDEGFPRRN